MSDVKRFFVIMFSSFLTVMVMNYFFPPRREKGDTALKEGDTVAVAEKKVVMAPINREYLLEESSQEDEFVALSNAYGTVQFATKTACPVSFLYEHDDEISRKKIPVFSMEAAEIPPLFLLVNQKGYRGYRCVKEGTDTVLFSYENSEVRIIKKYVNDPKLPLLSCTCTIVPKHKQEWYMTLLIPYGFCEKSANDFVFSQGKKLLYGAQQKNFSQQVIVAPRFIGAVGLLFAQLLVTQSSFVRSFIGGEEGQRKVYCETAPCTGEKTMTWQWYYGPKEHTILQKVASELTALGEQGWFHWIAQILFRILLWLYHVVKNFGVAIILLALLIRLLLFPFSFSTRDRINRQAEFSRRHKYIQKRYANDPEQKLIEQNKLIKEFGMIPGGALGCFPVLLQIPLMIALQRLLKNSIVLYNIPFCGWIDDLFLPDRYYVLPFVFVVLIYLQMTMMVKEPMKRLAMLLGACIMFFVFYQFSAGVLLFMISSSLATYLQRRLLGY